MAPYKFSLPREGVRGWVDCDERPNPPRMPGAKPAPWARPAPDEGTTRLSSTVFHSPHWLHLPSHFTVVRPQELHSKTVLFDLFAITPHKISCHLSPRPGASRLSPGVPRPHLGDRNSAAPRGRPEPVNIAYTSALTRPAEPHNATKSRFDRNARSLTPPRGRPEPVNIAYTSVLTRPAEPHNATKSSDDARSLTPPRGKPEPVNIACTPALTRPAEPHNATKSFDDARS